MRNLIQRITPYLILGVAIAAFIGLLILFSYILLWGLLIGLVVYGISAIKKKFFNGNGSSNTTNNLNTEPESKGRIIEHEEVEVHIKQQQQDK